MWQKQPHKSSYRESIKTLEADVQHANALLQVYADGMPKISSQDRKATVREFYAVVYPSLQQLEGSVNVLAQDNNSRTQFPEALGIDAIEGKRDLSGAKAIERDDECGICMECCTKTVLPDCGHSMCNRCFCNWETHFEFPL